MGEAYRRIVPWKTVAWIVPLVLVLGVLSLLLWHGRESMQEEPEQTTNFPRNARMDDGGYGVAQKYFLPVKDPLALDSIRDAIDGAGWRGIEAMRDEVERGYKSPIEAVDQLIPYAQLHLYEGQFAKAYEILTQARKVAESDKRLSGRLSGIIFMQAVAALRRGEVENCVDCQCEGSCIFPIQTPAVHQKRVGSELACQHFLEYLDRHPNDLGVRWLLTVAAQTLGEYPARVPEQYRLNLERFGMEGDIGKFTDVAPLLGLNRLNQSGGAIMDDFDNDGLLDVFITSRDVAMHPVLWRNKGDGTFEDRTVAAGLKSQLGGLYCVQTDYNNDGLLDIFIVRGAWTGIPQRPSLLRNNGDGTFTDVTLEAGLATPIDSQCCCWADFDNDGFLDVFVGGETVRARLYRNKGDGTFEEVGEKAGVTNANNFAKGATWGDYDGDGYPDLFVNNLNGPPRLFHNNRDGTFTDVARQYGMRGPTMGFSCWFWDFDNDGWLDIFAASYDPTLESVVRNMVGKPVDADTCKLYRNLQGKGFADVSRAMHVDVICAPMGSNFFDADNDGYLDFYLATGDPKYSLLIPNRMFRNVDGKRFADVTVTSGTGHLQKGHAIAAGDWDRDGNVDFYAQLGGAIPGDQAHNAFFQNPGHPDNRWITLKLVGQKTNRAAIGARIKIVTKGPKPQTICRHVTSGSSFGANSLTMTIGLGPADGMASLEIAWPTSQTTQRFENLETNQGLRITEFAEKPEKMDWRGIKH